MTLTFNKTYFLYAVILFITEVLIALFINDNFIRPYFGDFLVVILIYYFLKSFLKISIKTAAISVLLFSYFVETLQYFNFLYHIGLHESETANIIIGNYFSWIDMLAYSLGVLTVFYHEKRKEKAGRFFSFPA